MVVPELRTERLILRGWRTADRAPYAALNADPVVMEHFPAMSIRAQSDAHIDDLMARFDRGEPSLWAVEVVASGRFVGFTGLSVPRFEAPFTPCVEVGWRFAADAWGNGYATEAGRAAAAFGFADHALDEIVSFTSTTNVASQRVMQRLGMRHDPADDFDHPSLDASSPLRRHVLYRLAAADSQL